MHIFARNPSGIISHVPLDNLIWRLELVHVAKVLGVGIRYVASAGQSATAVAMLCGVDIRLDNPKPGNKLAKIGFPKKTPAENVERLQEAFKPLVNDGLKDRVVSELSASCVNLVKNYYSIEKAIRTGSKAGGHFEGWMWATSPDLTWSWPEEEKESTDDESE